MQSINFFDTLERFHNLLPREGDLALIILKGHLLIEEQINFLLEHRIPKFSALKAANLTTHQKICLAEAVIEESQENEKNDWLWVALKKLNSLRNDIAHKLSSTGIDDRVADFCSRVPKKLNSDNRFHNFEYALWIACSEVHMRTSLPDPNELQN
jgi:hypothetical protein